MVRHPVTEGVSSPPIGSTLKVQMKRRPSPKQARVGLQRELGMSLPQSSAGTGWRLEQLQRGLAPTSSCTKEDPVNVHRRAPVGPVKRRHPLYRRLGCC